MNLADPNMGIWPEINPGGLVDAYRDTPPSDRRYVASFWEAAENRLRPRASAKQTPAATAARLDGWADAIEAAVTRARSRVGSGNREWLSSEPDFLVLAALARYHARKQLAADALTWFDATGDAASLARARRELEAAVARLGGAGAAHRRPLPGRDGVRPERGRPLEGQAALRAARPPAGRGPRGGAAPISAASTSASTSAARCQGRAGETDTCAPRSCSATLWRHASCPWIQAPGTTRPGATAGPATATARRWRSLRRPPARSTPSPRTRPTFRQTCSSATRSGGMESRPSWSRPARVTSRSRSWTPTARRTRASCARGTGAWPSPSPIGPGPSAHSSSRIRRSRWAVAAGGPMPACCHGPRCATRLPRPASRASR